MKKLFTITELSNLTNKTRPTLYKYISAYDAGNYNELPYIFKKLFDLIENEGTTIKEVEDFCIRNFNTLDETNILNNIFNTIQLSKDNLDLDKLLGDLQNGRYSKK